MTHNSHPIIENPSLKQGALRWDFPLPRVHTGIALANGRQGVLVWGDDRLCLTVARAGFWDHRGGNPFTHHITYAEMRSLLEAGREDEVRARFARQEQQPGQPGRPRQIAGGRIELLFPSGLRPASAELFLSTGVLTIALQDPATGADSPRIEIVLRQALDRESFWIEMPDEIANGVIVSLIASYDASRWVKEALDSTGCEAPHYWESANAGGFEQSLPEDPALALAWHRDGNAFCVTTALGGDAVPPSQADRDEAAAAAAAWWEEYWETVPRLVLPDEALQAMHTYGLFKLAGLTHPGGVAATLQGAWMEEVRVPLWSNDYHFNINLQMIYDPLLSCGRPEHFGPLWDMMRGWLPHLRETARAFLGADDALMLPHAVDDRCQAIGSFWKGTIDHASTAWMAQMAFRYYRHSGDEAFLRDVAYPLMLGAFNGFWAMSETLTDENGRPRLSLPVSVSPEYGEGGPGGWGRDSSFQLAAWRCVARILPDAAARLGQPADPRWERVIEELPPYTTVPVPVGPWDAPGAPPKKRIALWEGQDLEHSHRHHSHLAGIYPFLTVDPRADRHTPIVGHSLRHWVTQGAGQWSAWCLPWAASILARCERADAAVAWLHWLIETHANEGGSIAAGGMIGCNASWGGADENRDNPEAHEVMQLDANMGVISAIHELLVQCRPVANRNAGEPEAAIHVLPCIPRHWGSFRFDRIHAEGGFLIGATVDRKKTTAVRVSCQREEPLLLFHGLGKHWMLNGVPHGGDFLLTTTTPGQELLLERAF